MVLGRRERKKLEVRERIRQAAVELFRERGYEETTVEEIADRADVAKGTFFNYFARKDALLESLAEGLLDELHAALGPPDTWRGTAREQMMRLFLQIGEFVGSDPELSKIMMIENMRNFWLRTDEDLFEQEFRRMTRQVLTAASDRGEFPDVVDVEAAAQLVESVFHMTIVEWLKSGTPGGELESRFGAQFDIIFRGLGAGALAEKGEGR